MSDQSVLSQMAGANDELLAVDWLGQALHCSSCALHNSGSVRCVLGHSCVHDRYARRIDRFFRWNPQQADYWLTHPYFEVRAIASKHASIFKLANLVDDPDETVRLSVAVRLPQRLLKTLIHDPHREVRIRVAMRLEPMGLLAMIADEDYYVRLLVARRLPLSVLTRMAADGDSQVRLEVASRLESQSLAILLNDPEVLVRYKIAERAPEGLLEILSRDEAWEVRRVVALRAPANLAMRMTHDPEGEVVAAARERLESLNQATTGQPLLDQSTTEQAHGGY